MRLQHAFDDLSQVLEQFERHGRSVRDVETTTDPDSAGALDVSMTMPVSLCASSSGTLDSSLTLERASLSDSGNLTVSLSVSDLLPELSTAETVVDINGQAAHVDDGTLIMSVGFRIVPPTSTAAATTPTEDGVPDEGQSSDASGADTDEATGKDGDTLAARLLAAQSVDVSADDAASDREQSPHGTGEGAKAVDGSDDEALTARLATARSEDVPAYEDTDYLRVLYESCGTFTEMSDRIEMDVAAETVRRYMIEADIHEPRSYDTAAHDSEYGDDPDDGTGGSASGASDSDTALEGVSPEPSQSTPENTEAEQFVTDGIGLPEGVTVEDIVNAVVDATAVYEVQRSLNLGHGQTRDLLRQLNILDLVLHRIDGRPDGVSKNDVVQRIRECEPGAT